jgi:hypothetical protein
MHADLFRVSLGSRSRNSYKSIQRCDFDGTRDRKRQTTEERYGLNCWLAKLTASALGPNISAPDMLIGVSEIST